MVLVYFFGTKPLLHRSFLQHYYNKLKSEHITATDRAQLAHRYDTVVAKWSRSPQSTREQPNSHRKPIDLPQISYGAPETCSTPIPILRKESFSTILATSKYYDAA